MQYLSEINEFYIWLETNQLTYSEITLWHALMHIANKTGWQDRFAVAISVLEFKTGLEKRSVLRARNSLSQKKRIRFYQKSNSACEYSIISFCCSKNVPANGTASGTVNDTANGTASGTVNGTINRQEKNRQKKKEKNTKKEKFEVIEFLKPLDFSREFKNTFFEFSKMREERDKPKPLTERAAKMVINKLREFGYSESQMIECLRNSIISEWDGVFKLTKTSISAKDERLQTPSDLYPKLIGGDKHG